MFNERLFRAQMTLKGLTGKDVAEHLCITEPTFYRKMKRGGDFTRDEINKLIDLLGITDPMRVFFADKLTETQVQAD